MRGDAEDGVGGHAAAGFFVGPAKGAFVDDFAVLEDEGDGAGEAAIVDELLEEGIEAGEAVFGD